jgi:hypothetical protein
MEAYDMIVKSGTSLIGGSPLQILAIGPYMYHDDGKTSINPLWRQSLWEIGTVIVSTLSACGSFEDSH